jgi:hypothetical protein
MKMQLLEPRQNNALGTGGTPWNLWNPFGGRAEGRIK